MNHGELIFQMSEPMERPKYHKQPGFYSGTSGLVLPVSNKSFYPDAYKNKSRLTYYASMLNSIEINSSFYKIPMPSTVRNWSEQVPESFMLTFKLWRGITHNKGLSFAPEDVSRFMQTIDQAGRNKGSLLVQFPPSLKISMFSQLEKLMDCITASDPERHWKTALEFRHSSWYHEEVYELCDSKGFGIVIHDKPGSATPAIDQEAGFRYLRFHGPDGDYKGSYDVGFLNEYAEYVTEWIQEGKTVFTYFNNTVGEALKNLTTLNTLVNQEQETDKDA
ncbi:DUF72 domain-containing protein [Dyadobacter sediminis]|nr:DUF72 domain-containing protein [Dyadobacter sediminis]